MSDKNVTTVVFHNGYTIQFHLREDRKRFKVFSSFVLEKFKHAYPSIHYDDCDGEELATIIRFAMSM